MNAITMPKFTARNMKHPQAPRTLNAFKITRKKIIKFIQSEFLLMVNTCHWIFQLKTIDQMKMLRLLQNLALFVLRTDSKHFRP